jgi:segregation and condensation protein B
MDISNDATEGAIGSPRDLVGAVEALLWAAQEPLNLKKITAVTGASGVGEVRDAVAKLRGRFAARRSAIELVEVAGGLRLTTRPAYAPWLQRLFEGPAAGARLSGAAAETLAIVAYRQPVVRAEVEAIRGVGCGDVLRQLLEVDLLRIVGRSEELGRPLLYGTTGRFLELYGLGSLEDLPDRGEGADRRGPTTDNDPAASATSTLRIA